MISDGLAAVDSSSDWNAPTEPWGNCEESKIDAPVLKEMPKPLGVWKIQNLKCNLETFPTIDQVSVFVPGIER